MTKKMKEDGKSDEEIKGFKGNVEKYYKETIRPTWKKSKYDVYVTENDPGADGM